MLSVTASIRGVDGRVKSTALVVWEHGVVSPGVRAARRDDIGQRILAIGRRHLSEHGAAALSLRAVARDLGMVSSAVYRYVADRDDLLTLLLVDAYAELADEVDTAVAAASRAGWDTRILVAARAVRRWGLREPARYALLYGSPVPGYVAPERTTEPGTRVIRVLVALVEEGVRRGDIHDGSGPQRPRHADLVRVRDELGAVMDAAVLGRAVGLWATLFGVVSLEVFGQLGNDTFAEPDLLFEQQIRLALVTLRG
jgi:AcrR family transcriptional regulator